MPPCATQPATSYWPATTSPLTSLGLNENGAPHLRQKPSSRPGVPSRDRPTGSLQRAQKRRFSATSGVAMIAVEGSRDGAAGRSMIPAPSWLREDPEARAVVPRRARAVAEPIVRATVSDGAGIEPTAAGAPAGLGAMPHTSQYPSAIAPLQPGCSQVIAPPR